MEVGCKVEVEVDGCFCLVMPAYVGISRALVVFVYWAYVSPPTLLFNNYLLWENVRKNQQSPRKRATTSGQQMTKRSSSLLKSLHTLAHSRKNPHSHVPISGHPSRRPTLASGCYSCYQMKKRRRVSWTQLGFSRKSRLVLHNHGWSNLSLLSQTMGEGLVQ